jgi:glycerol kinase
MILAIDQGTTSTTCLVCDQELRVLGRASNELPQHFPQPGWVEHDADEIWESVISSAAAALDAAGVPASELEAIGITNQRETTVLWERATGRPVAPAIVWQDRRTAEECADLPFDLIRERTGLVPDPYFSATKLRWLLARTSLPPERLAFGTVDSWLVWRLTGGDRHVTDRTNASRTMLAGLRTDDWDAELLELLSIPREVLPDIVDSAGPIGEAELFGARVAITGMAGDQQAALFGQGCLEPGDAKATYGTGVFVLVHDGEHTGLPPHGLLRTACVGGFALEGSVFIAGAAVQWLRDGLGVLESSEQSAGLAASVPDTGGVHFVPALAGLGSPWWRPDARGLISGLHRGTRREHLVRAALEGIAFQVRDVLDAAGAAAGSATVRVDGGATANPVLMQFQADILQRPVEVAAEREATGIGAAGLACLGAGVWTGPEPVRDLRRTSERYEPAMSADRADELHAAWLEAVNRAL